MAKQDIKNKLRELQKLFKKQQDFEKKNKNDSKLAEETKQFFAELDERRKQRAEEIKKIFNELDQAIIDFLPEE